MKFLISYVRKRRGGEAKTKIIPQHSPLPPHHTHTNKQQTNQQQQKVVPRTADLYNGVLLHEAEFTVAVISFRKTRTKQKRRYTDHHAKILKNTTYQVGNRDSSRIFPRAQARARVAVVVAHTRANNTQSFSVVATLSVGGWQGGGLLPFNRTHK